SVFTAATHLIGGIPPDSRGIFSLNSPPKRPIGDGIVHVLLVDDEDFIRAAPRRPPAVEGFAGRPARDGEEALARCQERTPDLVITDLFMPEKEGIETIQDLKRDHPNVKIIAMSGGNRGIIGDFLSMARMLGAQATLSKPFLREELLSTIEHVLAAG